MEDNQTPSTSKSGGGYFPCSLCPKAYSTQEELANHMKKHGFICNICDKTFANKSNLKRHMSVMHAQNNQFECKDCKQTFTDKSNLDRHVKSKHIPVKSTLTCDICQQDFTDERNLKRHIKLKHDNITIPFECTECDVKFPSKSNLERHLKLKHDNISKPFECTKCDAKFPSKSNLERHLRLKHDNISNPYECTKCDAKFPSKSNLERHINQNHTDKTITFTCDFCNKKCTTKSNLHRHIALKHADRTLFDCDKCLEKFSSKSSLKRHIDEVHNIIKIICKLCVPPKQFNSRRVIELHNKVKHNTPRGRFTCPKCLDTFSLPGNFKRHLEDKHNVKSANFSCKRCPRKFKTESGLIQHLAIKHRIKPQRVVCNLCNKSFATNSSLILHLKIIHSMVGGCYFCRVCDYKFENKDEFNLHKCFGENVVDSKFILKSPPNLSREESFIHAVSAKNRSFDFGDNATDFPGFEERNNVSLSIFRVREGKLTPSYVTNAGFVDESTHIDLIKVNDAFHLILDFGGLLRSRFSKHMHVVKMCRRCCANFYNTLNYTAEEQLKRHKEFCQGYTGGPLFHDTPKGDKANLRFRNYEHLKKKRFTIYLDFESLTTTTDSTQNTNTVTLQKHIPFCFGYLLKDDQNNEHTNYTSHCGLDAPSVFFSKLKEDVEKIEGVLYANRIRDVPELTQQQQLDFDEATVCHICNRGGFDSRNKKVRSHDHVSGLYLGPAHNTCNLFYRDMRTVSVICHNLSRYDANFIIPELAKDDGQITIIPHTTDKFISFTKKIGGMKVQFIDSFRFLSSSLDQLSGWLDESKKLMCRRFFPNNDQFNLITSKGFLPYDYISSLSKLDEETLPTIESFYSILSDEHITEQNYEHAQMIWRVFNCKTLKDYVMIYQMCDVLLLTDVFEDFREMSIIDFQLDPTYYVSAPGLTFDAMLRYTNVTIELLTDLQMVKFVQKALRGGLVGCSHRLTRANNPYMEHLYDPSKPKTYLWYIDANNLYGLTLGQPLPLNGFSWVEGDNILLSDILNLPPDSDVGYFVEADFEYPENLHDAHNDMPFLPEVQTVEGETMLMESLENRKNYICHHRTLQQAVQHGLIVSKIHRAIKFNQYRYIAPYIELTTQRRINSRNPFEEEFWKLMNNSLYGKTCERVEKRIQVKIPTTCEQTDKLIWSSQFIANYKFGEDLYLFHMAPRTIMFNKPIFIGAAVLDLSKVHLYSFFYDILKPKYGDRIQINYKDTDALLTTIHTNDLYKDIANDPKLLNELDTRNYDPSHPLFSLTNKLVPGKFKDEIAPNILTEFVGLRSKEYATKMFNLKTKTEETNKKKSKGTQKRLVKTMLEFEDYKDSLFDRRPREEEDTQIGIQLDNVRLLASKGTVSLIKQKKWCLNPKDKKRYILPNKIDTLAIGHYAIPKPDL